MDDLLPFDPPFGFNDVECVGLVAIVLFVAYWVWRMFKAAGKNGGPRWGE